VLLTWTLNGSDFIYVVCNLDFIMAVFWNVAPCSVVDADVLSGLHTSQRNTAKASHLYTCRKNLKSHLDLS
jgi:hypothetical protein